MRKYLVYTLIFLAGALTYCIISTNQNTRDLRNYQSSSSIRKDSTDKFISPLLLTGDGKTTYVNDDFTKKVSDYISLQKNNGNATEISYYIKNLRNSSWTGIDEDTHYAPASLMKVPILIAILKENEKNPELLKKQIYYKETQNYNVGQTYFPKKFIVSNNTYSVEDLLSFMIDYSDNNATILLFSLIPQKNIIQIFTDLDLPLPDNSPNATIDFISAKLYSRLFRVLYNSTYLSEENSSYALKLLSNSDFPNGISSNIPKEITISDKFGERTANDENKNIVYRELHDCGIVYLPDNPYTICIMTKGQEFSKLEKILQDLSLMTYNELK